jgi:hypothetical protein
MRKLVTVIVLIALGAVVQTVLHAIGVASPRPVTGFGAEFPPYLVRTVDLPPTPPGFGRGFLIDKHLAGGLQCSSCHTEDPPAKQPDWIKCLDCHGGSYTKLAEMTAKVYPNPHASHQGALPCTWCHHNHKRSETYCERCHSWDFKTP